MKKNVFKILFVLSFLLVGFNSPINLYASDNNESTAVENGEWQDGDVIEIPLVPKDRYVAVGSAGTLRMEYTRDVGCRYWIKVTTGVAADFYGQLKVTGPGTNKTFYVSGLTGSVSLSGLKKGTNYKASMIGQAVDFRDRVIAYTMDNEYGFQY